jgi:hypothetical protein|tara:strand:+ start:1292 stop:1678 length:387 start_codon:yes stop_codon:yes gene_type:complete
MAYESPGIDLGTLTAAGDLSSKQFYFVKLASATTVNVCTAITDLPIGILQNDPESGEQAVVRIFGISKVSADGTITAARWIGTSSDSQAAGITPGSDTTVYVMGQAIQAASAGETFTMFLNPSNCRAA